MNTSLQTIPLTHIRRSRADPRHEPNVGLDGLAASIGSEASPTMVQPPIVEQVGEREYSVIAGERRILAARQAGWQTILCIVHARLDPLQAHRLHLVENLHRKDLHPLDEAAALKIAWLSANAEATGMGDEARAILSQGTSPAEILAALQSLLERKGFSHTHPTVTWEVLLAQLGLDLDPERRKKLLGVLRVDSAVQEQARSLNLTEAALRAIGTLDPENQQRLAAEIAQDPSLARKARRIARVVRNGSYTLEEALAEARGLAPGEIPSEDPDPLEAGAAFPPEAPGSQELLLGEGPMEAAMELLEIANRLSTALAALAGACNGDLARLPQPWGEYARQALDLIQAETGRFFQEKVKGV